jgi:hypothetical protein
VNVNNEIDALARMVAAFERKALRCQSVSKLQASAEAARKAICRLTKQARYRLHQRARAATGVQKASRWALRWSRPPTHPPKLPAKLAAAEAIALERIVAIVAAGYHKRPRSVQKPASRRLKR